jgi:hypothetical protein
LVVASGRATSQAISTMLDSMTSAPAPTGVEPLSLSDDFQQLAGHCTATIANGQPPRLLLVEYGACSRSRLAYASPLPPYISVVAYSQVTVWTRGVGSWLVERLGTSMLPLRQRVQTIVDANDWTTRPAPISVGPPSSSRCPTAHRSMHCHDRKWIAVTVHWLRVVW